MTISALVFDPISQEHYDVAVPASAQAEGGAR